MTRDSQTLCWQRGVVALLILLGMQACSLGGDSIMDELELPTFGSEDDGVGSLEVPPNLDSPETRETYDVGSINEEVTGAGASQILPQRLGIRLRSEGNISWLVVGATPEGLWPHLTEFWRAYGFEIVDESMVHGRIETAWREQRVNVGTGLRVRDMFRMRIERAPYGATNIYLANRKATQVNGEWRVEFSDRETEVDILYDLSDYLASLREVKSADIAPLEDIQIELDIKNLSGVPVLSVAQAYSQVWRRLGVALERAGLDVRRADRSRGIYLIRYRLSEDEFTDSTVSQWLQLRLLQRGDITLVTVHPNRKREAGLAYETAYEVLQRVVQTYQLRA